MFAEYSGRVTAEGSYRRAVYKRKYVIICKVTTDQIVFLVIYHTSQDPDSIRLNDE